MAIRSTQSVQSAIPRTHAIVVCGGHGARFNAGTNEDISQTPLPKALLPAAERRLIDFSLHPLPDLGFHEVHLAEHYLGDMIRHQVGLGEAYGKDFKIHHHSDSPSVALDTAGSVARIVKRNGWEKENSLILILSADIVHNFDLSLVIATHLHNHSEHGAAATIVVNPVPWSEVKRFGTVILLDMPRKGPFPSPSAFEDGISDWIAKNQGKSFRVEGFKEKAPRPQCGSNLNNSSIYVFEGSFFKALFPRLTRKFSGRPLFNIPGQKSPPPSPFFDFGMHVFKWLTSSRGTMKKYPLYAFIYPATINNVMSYWRDIATGDDLLGVNTGLLQSYFVDSAGPFAPPAPHLWTREAWGFRGSNVYIDQSAIIGTDFPSMIGPNCVIHAGAQISNSVIGANTIVHEGANIAESVIFPKHPSLAGPNVIGRGTHLLDCIFCGGTVQPDAVFNRKMVYFPVGGMAIDSLSERTEVQ